MKKPKPYAYPKGEINAKINSKFTVSHGCEMVNQDGNSTYMIRKAIGKIGL